MNSPISYMGNDPIADQIREMQVRAYILSLSSNKDIPEDKEWDMDDEDIII